MTEQLGRYRITGVLGKGAMGVVYEGHDPQLDRMVAIKTMRIQHLEPDQLEIYERRFQTEARSSARLRHPAIVQVFDSGREDDVAFLVMEKVNGVNLKQCLNQGLRFNAEGVAAILQQVLQGLAHAHLNQVIHRDVKPENILVDVHGTIRITDFGIARLQDGPDHGTQVSGLAVGTPRYMSPEQVQGLGSDARSDLFAAGVLLYELLTGRPPFDGDSQVAVVHAVLYQEPLPPTARVPDLAPSWDELVRKALSKRPEHRFQSAEAFAAALSAVWREDPSNQLVSGPRSHGLATSAQVAPWTWVSPEQQSALSQLLQPVLQQRVEAGSSSFASARQTGVGPKRSSSPKPTLAAALTPTEFRWVTHPWYRFWQPWMVLAVLLGLATAWWVAAPQSHPPVDVPAPVDGPGSAATQPQPVPAREIAIPQPPAAKPVLVPEAEPSKPYSGPDPVAAPVSAPVPVLNPTKRATNPVQVAPKPPPAVEPAVPAPATSTRCSRMLEKASSGEPLTSVEQKEIQASCR